MAELIHLNGPPGVGKSTLARRYVAEHQGVLNCDIDVLRTLVGGWEDDFGMAGSLIRPAALAMIEAYLASGHDVVLPQLIARPTELARIEECARRAGGDLVERLLMDDVQEAVARFHRRGDEEPADPWHAQVRAIVAAEGGRRRPGALPPSPAGPDRPATDRRRHPQPRGRGRGDLRGAGQVPRLSARG